MIKISPAVLDDLNDIMKLEEATFGQIGKDAMASSGTTAERIKRCNGGSGRWYWIGKDDNRIIGDIILQPTRIAPEQCVSWNVATDNGTMNGTFAEEGANIFVVSFAVRQDAPSGTAELLVHAAFVQWLASGKKNLMFCSRMPGFAAAQKKNGIKPEEYWRLKHSDGGPLDPMLRFSWKITGGNPFSLLENGFPPDTDSGGHGVLFVLRDPVEALFTVANQIYAASKKH